MHPRIRLLPVTTCGLLHGAYMETTKKGSMPGADTRAAVIYRGSPIPRRLQIAPQLLDPA